jgi:hypothetical protein
MVGPFIPRGVDLSFDEGGSATIATRVDTGEERAGREAIVALAAARKMKYDSPFLRICKRLAKCLLEQESLIVFLALFEA